MRRLVVLGVLAAGGAALARRLRPGRGSGPAEVEPAGGSLEAPDALASAPPPDPVVPSTLEEEVAEAVVTEQDADAEVVAEPHEAPAAPEGTDSAGDDPGGELPSGWVQVDHVFPAAGAPDDEGGEAGGERPTD